MAAFKLTYPTFVKSTGVSGAMPYTTDFLRGCILSALKGGSSDVKMLFIAGLLTMALYGQPMRTIKPTVAGLSLTPSAGNALTLTVQTMKAVRSVSVLYEIDAGNGHTIRRVRILEPVNVTPGSTLTINTEPADDAVMRGKQVTASIDSAALADGEVVGPDTLNLFSRLVARQAQSEAFWQGLSAQLSSHKPEAEVARWLQAAATVRKPSHGVHDVDLASAAVARRAMAAMQVLQTRGLQALEQWAAAEAAAKRAPVPYRGPAQ